jgi:hypothetical protein
MNKKKEGLVTLDRQKAPSNDSYLFHKTQSCTCMAEMGQNILIL